MRQQWRLAKGKTWRDKLQQEHPNHGKMVTVPPRMRKRFGRGKMLIPRPLDVDAIMRRVRKGRLITQSQVRDALARQAGADCACPLTTGMFVRIAAEAAEEDRRQGRRRITPYWRVIRDDGRLNERFPGGAKAQAARLRAEGVALLPAKGRQAPKIEDFHKRLIEI